MSFGQLLRPYAAKAIVEHAFDTDHIDMWITFRFPMDVTVKPANAKWIVKVDSVVKAVTASAWQDEFTMLLTIDAIASIPTVVTLEYDGPDINLRITWLKQWEPWGAILSQDNALDPFGSFKGNEIAWQQAAAINTWYPILDAQISSGQTNKITFQNNGELKPAVAGFYDCYYYNSVECSIANKHILTAPLINGAAQPDGQNHYLFSVANKEETWSGGGILLLAVNDVLTVGIQTPDAGNPTLTVEHIGLKIHELT